MNAPYLDQIDKYYNKKLKSFSYIELGQTPDLLVKFGAPKLPLIMLQSTLTKCTRKSTGSRSAHELPRDVIESLPQQISNPIFLIQDKARNSIALISDAEDKSGNKILTAILLDTVQHANRVNEVKSIYGKTSLKEYLHKHIDLQQLNVIDNKKAEMLSRVLGLQLPMALITSNFDKNISSEPSKVNANIQKEENIEILGKTKMISLMRNQLENPTDLNASRSSFDYIQFDKKSERLVYRDDGDNTHDLYHGIVGGMEVCLYHVNNGRNRSIEIPRENRSVVETLKKYQQKIDTQPKVNNLERQHTQQER